MKLNDHLDFHKLPFDKEKIREQVEKIAAEAIPRIGPRGDFMLRSFGFDK
jgi:hypothetical protein